MTAKRRAEGETVQLEVIIERTTQSSYLVQEDEESMFSCEPIVLPKMYTRVLKISGGHKTTTAKVATIEIPEWLAIDRELV